MDQSSSSELRLCQSHVDRVQGGAKNDDPKVELSKSPCLAHFDPKLETRLETDASRKKGCGYALLQKQKDE